MNKFMVTSSVLILTFLVSIFSSAVYATQDSTDTEASLEVDSIINISAPSTVTLNCTPGYTNAAAELCTNTASVNVTTNNITGYTLQLNATSGSSNSLTNTAVSPSATIPTLSQAYTSANFPTNYWGYTGGLDKSEETGGYNCASNYCPVLAYESTESNYAPNHVIKVTDAPSTTSNTDITFGAKVDISKPSGTYATSVTFTAVINAVPVTTMQDFDSTACANATTDQTFTLTDTRDDKEYTVAKLQDGNCWMTQNLALGGSTAMNLTQADSNVGPSGFTLPAGVNEYDWTSSDNNPEFFDYASNYPSQQTTNKYGNYYNWPAATAGTNPSSGDSQYDICPKNWRLPSTSSTSTTNSEFYLMLNHYITTGSWNNTSWSGVTTTDFTSAPASLVFSGGCQDGVDYQGDRGWWWSATAGDDYAAGALYASRDGLVNPGGPPNNFTKDLGASIRCLTPGV